MTTTISETQTSTGAPESPPTVDRCPSCSAGGGALFTVELVYNADGGFRPDHYGVVPEQGDTVTRCDNCGSFFVHADDGTHLGAPTPVAVAPAQAADPATAADATAPETGTAAEPATTTTTTPPETTTTTTSTTDVETPPAREPGSWAG